MTAYVPISFIAIQYDQIGFWLKFYANVTTTPISMATDSTGGTLLAKAQVDDFGFLTTDGATRFIPFLSQSYSAYLFPTEAEADANNTTNAIRVANNINPFGDDFDIQKTAVPVIAGQTTYPLDFNVSQDAI